MNSIILVDLAQSFAKDSEETQKLQANFNVLTYDNKTSREEKEGMFINLVTDTEKQTVIIINRDNEDELMFEPTMDVATWLEMASISYEVVIPENKSKAVELYAMLEGNREIFDVKAPISIILADEVPNTINAIFNNETMDSAMSMLKVPLHISERKRNNK